MLWVAIVIRQASTKKAPEMRAERSASERVPTPREVYCGRKMHITVLVPNSHASSQWGASVACTSQSGITTLSSTWLVHIVPLNRLQSIQPTLCRGPRPRGVALRRRRLATVAYVVGGAREPPMKTALARPMTQREQRHPAHHRQVVERQRDAADDARRG